MKHTQDLDFSPIDLVKRVVKGFLPASADSSQLVLKSVDLDHEDFTDNGDATAEIDLGFDIPAGVVVEHWAYEIREAVAVDGAAGETDFSLQLGDGTDADRFNPATDPSETIASQSSGVQAVTPVLGAGGSGDGVRSVNTAITTPTLTLTLSGGTPDAGNFVAAAAAGKIRVAVFCRDLRPIFE